ncbi:MAG: nitroreductase [Candidatus Accumulibacter sp.]|jgi:nitroreductase|nr:nitroreductase [Accumulibacter sp.]
MTTSARTSSVDDIIHARRSIRRFLPTPVAAGAVRELLDLAARAPSGANVQPWRVYALAGSDKEALSRAITEKYLASGVEGMEIDYYPKQWIEPWLSRRRKVGADLYALLGIAKGDKEKAARQWLRNYRFFDAPVGLIFTVDRVFGPGMLLDYGMFLENLMLAARARGLDTCPQLAFTDFQNTIRQTLGLPENERIVCGMALGHADPEAPENQLYTERVPAETFADFRGFAPEP